MKLKKHSRVTIATVALLSLCIGNAFSQTKPKKDPQDPKLTASNVAIASEATPTSAPALSDYRIGATDVIDINVWKEPELSRTVPVRPDGKISLPLIGELVAEGKTAADLDDLIAERLKDLVRQPKVTVIVQQMNSRRYFVTGQVEHPGSFPLNAATDVVQAVAAAGSFKEWAHTNKITIVRHAENNQVERIHFDYKAWTKKKTQAGAPELKNGDVVVVP